MQLVDAGAVTVIAGTTARHPTQVVIRRHRRVGPRVNAARVVDVLRRPQPFGTLLARVAVLRHVFGIVLQGTCKFCRVVLVLEATLLPPGMESRKCSRLWASRNTQGSCSIKNGLQGLIRPQRDFRTADGLVPCLPAAPMQIPAAAHTARRAPGGRARSRFGRAACGPMVGRGLSRTLSPQGSAEHPRHFWKTVLALIGLCCACAARRAAHIARSQVLQYV